MAVNDVFFVRGGKRGGDLTGDSDGAFERKLSFALNRFLKSFAVDAFGNDINALFLSEPKSVTFKIFGCEMFETVLASLENRLTIFSSTASAGERILTVTGLSIKRCVPR